MRVTRRDGDQTRGRLLAAAGSVFAARGFRDATTAEICRMAGANIAAVHYHFGSKKNLYAEAWRHAFERSIAVHPPDGGVAPDAPATQRLKGQILAIVRRLMNPDSIDVDIVHREMASPTGLLAEVMRRSIDPMHRRFADTVRELLGPGASAQAVRLCEMSIHAQCFAPLARERRNRLSGGGRRPSFHPLGIDADVLADHIFRFSLAGIRGLRGKGKTVSIKGICTDR